MREADSPPRATGSACERHTMRLSCSLPQTLALQRQHVDMGVGRRRHATPTKRFLGRLFWDQSTPVLGSRVGRTVQSPLWPSSTTAGMRLRRADRPHFELLGSTYRNNINGRTR